MVPGITERERRVADDVRWDWLADTRNRMHFIALRPYGQKGLQHDSLPRGRIRGLWPALVLRRQPRLTHFGAVERALG